jgi:predicted transcriptional regulator
MVMTEQERMHCELTAHMFRALAHPLRVFLLERLSVGQWCICELATEAGIDKSVASKHLSMLREAAWWNPRDSALRCSIPSVHHVFWNWCRVRKELS